MARELDLQIPHFDSATHILGCVAHVINLAAKVGISALGPINKHLDGDEISMATNDAEVNGQGPMNISSLVSTPDGVGINAQTINKRIHALCTWVRFSPQRRERFAKAVDSCQPDLYAKGIKCLEIDVATRWNSTYEMFRRALMLQKSCTHFCQQNSEASAYTLSPAEWDHARGIMKLLEPLSEATNVLCASKYPTLNNALPVYIVLLEHLHTAHRGLYDQAQLIQPAQLMIEKIDEYLQDAVKKPVYIVFISIDPRFKTMFWKTQSLQLISK